MREIKFRVRYKNSWCIIELNKGLTDFGYEAYMECVKNGEKFYQYTGLKDKNGKEIYEGDIITDDAGELVYDEVIFNKGCFCIKKGENLYHIFNEKNVKVIGNIFENPELINK